MKARGVVLLLIAGPAAAAAQTPARIEVRPDPIVFTVGDSVRLEASVLDARGDTLEVPVFFFSSQRRRLAVSREGVVTARDPGEYQITARVATPDQVRAVVPVVVAPAPVVGIDVQPAGERLYVGTSVRLSARVIDAVGYERDYPVHWTSSDERVASVDRTGLLSVQREGAVVIRATSGGVTVRRPYRAVPSPVRTLDVTLSADSVRTGDVVRVSAVPRDGSGRAVADAPIQFALHSYPEDTVKAQFPAAEVDRRGRFVAYQAGHYTVVAMSGGVAAERSLIVSNRRVSRRIELAAQGAVRDVHTSDLWVWEGADGRDYAITGTWGANGGAYVWDVTDPAAHVLLDSVVVDARTVNDVKVSEDGSICVISREGASNRRNGIVIIDCSNPGDVQILSQYDDDLTGGVHNLFVYRNHVYAVNNGRKYDVINIEDPTAPYRVAVFELDTPGHAIHDVWIEDGIAYSSNWQDGTVLVDVGNGKWGGSPSNPIEIARFTAVGGANHAVFPYESPTGKTYLFMGDERFPYGLSVQPGGTPTRAGGYIHVIDITDLENPEEVARYEVPEAGSHNLWISGDTLYAAFYNGGLRVVDISGELKGNLYYQNREIAHFIPYDPEGVIANAPFVWGPQPHKGHIFFSDWNSGLWAVKLETPEVLTP